MLGQRKSWTHIIVGAGTAGCLLAARLAERDPRHRVLLLEGGGSDRGRMRYRIPCGYLACIGNPKADWLYYTEPDAGLNGRKLRYPRGKTLGGCSSINGMLFLRGQKEDFDGWAASTADAAWGWDNALRLSKRHEKHWGGRSPYHGADGELHVQKQRLHYPILDDLALAAEEMLKLPRVTDFNTGDNEGVGYFEVTQRRGRRWSASDAFLFKPPAERSDSEWFITQQIRELVALAGLRGTGGVHPNLDIMPDTVVDKIVFDGDKCVGVKVNRNDDVGVSLQSLFELDDNDAANVILCAGAVSTPAILLRSGIGASQELARLGVKTIVDLPRVGKNLQDHLQVRTVYRLHEGGKYTTLNTMSRSPVRAAKMALDYALYGKGPLAMAPSQLGAFARSNSSEKRANVEFHIQPLSLDTFGEPLHPYDAVTVSVCNLRPRSRGTISVTSTSPTAAPVIRPNYLSDDYDRIVAAESIRLARTVMASPGLCAKYRPEEVKPGVALESLGDLVRAAGDISTTIFHPSCTVAMGRDDDQSAPLTSRLAVRGTRRLRVCDASAMPNITSGNTNEPVLILAERLADILCPL